MEDPRSDSYDAEFAKKVLPASQWLWAPAAAWSEVGLIEWAWYRDLVFLTRLSFIHIASFERANNEGFPLFSSTWTPEGVTPQWTLAELEPGKGTVRTSRIYESPGLLLMTHTITYATSPLKPIPLFIIFVKGQDRARRTAPRSCS